MKKYGLLFPGQGSQVIGMGRELYETQRAARWVFDKAQEVLGRDIKKLCFEGPEEELENTANSQPAIFTVSIATLNVLVESFKSYPVGECAREIFTRDDIQKIGALSMGLSLGEPTALVASGAISFEDGLRFVENRGRFMEDASKKRAGKMASIMGLDLEKVEKICMGVGCQVANLNSPGQVVISGDALVVELASELAKKEGARRVIMLKVSGAFHSSLMAEARNKLKTFLDAIEIKEPVVNFISNIDAKITKLPDQIRTNLIDQLTNRTLWEDSMRTAIALGVKDFLEIGPGTVLKGLAKKIDESINVIPLHISQDISQISTT